MRGRFVVLEGLDGAGISTQARRLVAALEERGVPCFGTREPSDSPIGGQIRAALAGRIELEPATLALLFAADRHDHVHHVLLPRLQTGRNVVSERHLLSSLAYQGAQLGDPEWVRTINRASRAALRPDLTVFLDAPPEASLARIDASRHARELFEQQETLAITRAAYLGEIDVLRAEGDRIEVVDATGSIADVGCRVLELTLETIDTG